MGRFFIHAVGGSFDGGEDIEALRAHCAAAMANGSFFFDFRQAQAKAAELNAGKRLADGWPGTDVYEFCPDNNGVRPLTRVYRVHEDARQAALSAKPTATSVRGANGYLWFTIPSSHSDCFCRNAFGAPLIGDKCGEDEKGKFPAWVCTTCGKLTAKCCPCCGEPFRLLTVDGDPIWGCEACKVESRFHSSSPHALGFKEA